MMLGDQAGEGADPEEAKEQYELAWDEWAKIFEQYPQLVDDEMADDLKEVIFRYKLVLDQLDEEFPEDFKLEMMMKPERRGRGTMPGVQDGRKPSVPRQAVGRQSNSVVLCRGYRVARYTGYCRGCNQDFPATDSDRCPAVRRGNDGRVGSLDRRSGRDACPPECRPRRRRDLRPHLPTAGRHASWRSIGIDAFLGRGGMAWVFLRPPQHAAPPLCRSKY